MMLINTLNTMIIFVYKQSKYFVLYQKGVIFNVMYNTDDHSVMLRLTIYSI